MELEFEIRQQKQTVDAPPITGWERERAVLFTPPECVQSPLLREIFWSVKAIGDGMEYEDELQIIANLAILTMLSFAGVYQLIDYIAQYNPEDLDDQHIDDIIDELKETPQNNMGFEEKQERRGFTMTMGGF